MENRKKARHLNEFFRQWVRMTLQDADGLTFPGRAIEPKIGLPRLPERERPRLVGQPALQAGADVAKLRRKIQRAATGSVSGSTPGISLVRVRHRPERSGLPSAARGAGAVRLGLPSLPFGTPCVGWLIHCAEAGAHVASSNRTAAVFIGSSAASYTAIRRRLRDSLRGDDRPRDDHSCRNATAGSSFDARLAGR
jgi:hypothetical protein